MAKKTTKYEYLYQERYIVHAGMDTVLETNDLEEAKEKLTELINEGYTDVSLVDMEEAWDYTAKHYGKNNS